MSHDRNTDDETADQPEQQIVSESDGNAPGDDETDDRPTAGHDDRSPAGDVAGADADDDRGLNQARSNS